MPCAIGIDAYFILFHSINELFDCVSDELHVINSTHFTFFESSIDREQSGLISFLWLDKRIDPILLSSFKCFDDVLLVKQMLLVLAEVLRAHVFNAVQLVVVLLLQSR